MTDINVKFDGFDVYDVEPAVLPTLFAQRPIILLGKWRGEPAGTVQITGKTGNCGTAQISIIRTCIFDIHCIGRGCFLIGIISFRYCICE